MCHRALTACKAILGFILGLLLWGLQVKPDEALSNAAAWLNRFGFYDLPAWLTRASTDQYFSWVVVAALLAVFAWIIWPIFPRVKPKGAGPDMPIHKAIDYIVNDSGAILRKIPPGYDEGLTSNFTWQGEQHPKSRSRVARNASGPG
jgi:hypothetical protein